MSDAEGNDRYVIRKPSWCKRKCDSGTTDVYECTRCGCVFDMLGADPGGITCLGCMMADNRGISGE